VLNVAGMNIFLPALAVAEMNIFTSPHSGWNEYSYQGSLWQE
jgi:hypothetical protein